MNILALSYLFPNAAHPHYGVFVFNRLKAVQETCNVKVIAPVQWYPFISRFATSVSGKVPKRESIQEIDVYHPRFLTIPRYMKWWDAFSYTLSVLPVVSKLWRKKYRFDLIDVHWTYPDILAGYLLSRLAGRPFLVTLRGREALYLDEKGGRKFILDSLLRKADAVIALSSELCDLARQIGVKEQRLKIVLNGVDVGIFLPVDRAQARMRLGLPDGKKILISVGSLIERKGHHEIIKILPRLKDRFDLDLYIIGDVNPEGDFSKDLFRLVKDLGLKNVHFVGRVEHDRLAGWYNAADIFCLATRGEGCPNVVLEALACGTPSVVMNVGAVPDIVEHGKDGLVVEDFDGLESSLIFALDALWDRDGISRKTRSRTWKVCASDVVEIYHEVLTGRRDRGKA